MSYEGFTRRPCLVAMGTVLIGWHLLLVSQHRHCPAIPSSRPVPALPPPSSAMADAVGPTACPGLGSKPMGEAGRAAWEQRGFWEGAGAEQALE